MLFTEKTLITLEYDKIIDTLSSLAATDGARAMAKCLTPSDDFDTVVKRQRRTDDAKRFISYKGYPAFSAPESVVGAADRAYKGAILSPRELLDVASLLQSARAMEDYIGENKPFDSTLDELFSRVITNRELELSITRSIISEEIIADEASPELAEIRRKIRITNNKIKDTLQGYVGGNKIKYLQENIVTMRNGRYVVPVKAEYKNELKGLVHDTSSSGATLFVEPIAVVEANNELKTLKAAEAHEIERILSELSASVAESSGIITVDYHTITELAFIYACATLAMQMRAVKPELVDESKIKLRRARHPLIPRDRVVPIDVAIGDDIGTLIITGPNTGGKTVTLKTLGLLTLMAQAGLQVPADEGSICGMFHEVLVDIGDEQSIEASLSTFSSHMVNVVDILNRVSSRSLVLFDELGSGTDPIEGAALAVAVLEKTASVGALTAATTHYAELKVYALNTEGVQNASCEFDIETLRPTYRLIVGTPGKSNAFAISEKLGISPEIINRASEIIKGEDKRFEDVIERLDTSRIEMEKEKALAKRLREEYESEKRIKENELERKIKKTEEEISKQVQKARQIIDSARASSEFIFQRLEEIRKQEDKEKRDAQIIAAREQIRDKLRYNDALYDGFDIRNIEDDDYKLPRPLKVGDKVFVTTCAQEGEIVAINEKSGIYSVNAGILKTKVTVDKLRLIEGNVKYKKAEAPKKISEGKVKKTASSTFSPEVDVRGMIGDDAWYVVDKYLDDAVLAGIGSVRIIHGKGTGALRAALWKNFKTDPRIKTYRHGNYGEGDAGVTVIEFKR